MGTLFVHISQRRMQKKVCHKPIPQASRSPEIQEIRFRMFKFSATLVSAKQGSQSDQLVLA